VSLARLGKCAAWAAALAVVSAPASALASPPPSYLSARAVSLIEASTGQGLYGYDQAQELPIASTTKLMTALVTIEHARLSQVFAEPDYYPAAVDSQIGLRPGERMSVHDLLLALLLPSADDAAEDLAYNVGHGSVSRFIGMMNARARELGLRRTHYSTPIGLDAPGNYSSASDLVRLASFLLLHHPFFAHAVALPSALLRTGDYHRFVTNRNTLVGAVPWVNGVKTGHTLGAGYVLVGSGTRDGMTLVSAVLGTPDETARNSDTLTVLRYGFANFRLSRPLIAGRILARLPIKNQPGRHADVLALSSYARVVRRDARITIKLALPRQLSGPLRRHATVGSVEILDRHRVLARLPLVVAEAVPAAGPLTLGASSSTILILLVALGTAAGLERRRRQRRARRPAERRGSVARRAAHRPPASTSTDPLARVGGRADVGAGSRSELE